MQETFWQEEVMVNLENHINIEKKPRVILRKGEEYEAVTTYRFETE